jgi:hypothetical protein
MVISHLLILEMAPHHLFLICVPMTHRLQLQIEGQVLPPKKKKTRRVSM